MKKIYNFQTVLPHILIGLLLIFVAYMGSAQIPESIVTSANDIGKSYTAGTRIITGLPKYFPDTVKNETLFAMDKNNNRLFTWNPKSSRWEVDKIRGNSSSTPRMEVLNSLVFDYTNTILQDSNNFKYYRWDLTNNIWNTGLNGSDTIPHTVVTKNFADNNYKYQVLPTVNSMMYYAGNATTVTITDSLRGGIFNLTTLTGNAVDSGVVFPSAISGYVWKRQWDKSTFGNIRWFNVNSGNITTDTTNFKKGVKALVNVYVPKGVYNVGSIIDSTLLEYKIIGAGRDSTILNCYNSIPLNIGAEVFVNGSINASNFGFTLQNISLIDVNNNIPFAIYNKGVQNLDISNNTFLNFNEQISTILSFGKSIVKENRFYAPKTRAIHLQRGNNLFTIFRNIFGATNGVPLGNNSILIESTTTENWGVTITKNDFYVTGSSYKIFTNSTKTENLKLNENWFEGDSLCISIQNVKNFIVENNLSLGGKILINSCNEGRIVNNRFTGCTLDISNNTNTLYDENSGTSIVKESSSPINGSFKVQKMMTNSLPPANSTDIVGDSGQIVVTPNYLYSKTTAGWKTTKFTNTYEAVDGDNSWLNGSNNLAANQINSSIWRNGAIGIGTPPISYSLLTLSRSDSTEIVLGTSVNGSRIRAYVNGVNNRLHFSTNNNVEAVTINENNNLGINNVNPIYRLDVTGNAKISVLGAGNTNDKFVTDSSGVLRDISLSAAVNGTSWGLIGNSGTIAATNFIGTTDNKPLVFKINNGIAGKIDGTLNNVSLGAATIPLASSATGSSAFGHGALASLATGSNNTAQGAYALIGVTGSSNNTGIGQSAGGTITSGNNNTFLGSNADAITATLTNVTAIGANAKVSANNSLVLGNGVNVGINNSSPLYKLDIDAKTASTGNPIRAQGLKIGAATDSILCDSLGLFRHLTAAQVVQNGITKTSVTSTFTVPSLGEYLIPFTLTGTTNTSIVAATYIATDVTGCSFSIPFLAGDGTGTVKVINRTASAVTFTGLKVNFAVLSY